MNADRQVLVVDKPQGSLEAVMEQLDELGFRVIWVPTLSAALEFLEANNQLSLIIASSAAGKMGGLDFLARAKEVAPEVRIIWGVQPDEPQAPRSAGLVRGPDSLIPEPFRSDALRGAIAELLAEHFYPRAVAEAIEIAALEVLRTIRAFEVEGGAFLVPNQTALSDVSAVIPFGGGVSGHLMVGVTRPHAEALYRAYLPQASTVRIDRMEDFVGELCNQILGRINAFFATHAVSIQHGTPIFIRAAGSTLRYPGRHPSFAVSLVEPIDHARVSLEYYLAEFDRKQLQDPVPSRVLGLGEIRYF